MRMRLIILTAVLLLAIASPALASEPCPAFSQNMNDIERALEAHERTRYPSVARMSRDNRFIRFSSADRVMTREAVYQRLRQSPRRVTAIGAVSRPIE